ncbi:MAG: ATP-dependent helicase [Actinomycetales bacterium]|nr:MAG: ATP-dependent helicase [Actinomycetales bacterium]
MQRRTRTDGGGRAGEAHISSLGARANTRRPPCAPAGESRAAAYSGAVATLDDLLHAAVAGIGGVERPGQVQMTKAVDESIRRGTHLLVQAGTGTGKSLAYLVPAVHHAFDTGRPAVVATATLALQAQIVDRDLPRLADAVEPLLGRRPAFVMVKGRRNYLCLHKLAGGYPDDDGLLAVGEVDQAAGRLGKEIGRLRAWAETTTSGDRDELVPGVSERAWRQVSVSAHECLAGKCPMITECFVELSRAAAGEADVIVTNHSFMAIDSFEGRQMLPDHDLLIVDEAHELVDRVTSTITDELTSGMLTSAARKAGKRAESGEQAQAAAALLDQVLEGMPEGRVSTLPDSAALALNRIRDVARAMQSELKTAGGRAGSAGGSGGGRESDAGLQVARAAVDEVFENADRILEGRELDVLWLTHEQRRGAVLRVAPISVAMLVRDKVFAGRTLVLTSATLELGGSFDAIAGTIGLRGEGAPEWSGLDVGSPFDYRRQAIAYVAAHLPAPGRDGTSMSAIDEMEALVRAAGGRTLGLFSSMRAAQSATELLRERFDSDGTPIEILCQGEDQIATLVRRFARDATTCLFGTLSLWQGVDVPGSACQLVVIDRIPFPRPDDPLSSARTQAISRMGGNGFMAVSATHAALRLAQGAGRLIRRSDDRGVVAFLDSRMISARYAGFLQRSLPPFWPTTNRSAVLAALGRLDHAAPDPLPVAEPGARAGGGSAASASLAGGGADATVDARPVAGPPPGAPSARTAVTGGYAWTSAQDAELADAAEAGVDLDDLVDHFELPAEVIQARLAQLDLHLDTPRLGFD